MIGLSGMAMVVFIPWYRMSIFEMVPIEARTSWSIYGMQLRVSSTI